MVGLALPRRPFQNRACSITSPRAVYSIASIDIGEPRTRIVHVVIRTRNQAEIRAKRNFALPKNGRAGAAAPPVSKPNASNNLTVRGLFHCGRLTLAEKDPDCSSDHWTRVQTEKTKRPGRRLNRSGPFNFSGLITRRSNQNPVSCIRTKQTDRSRVQPIA